MSNRSQIKALLSLLVFSVVVAVVLLAMFKRSSRLIETLEDAQTETVSPEETAPPGESEQREPASSDSIDRGIDEEGHDPQGSVPIEEDAFAIPVEGNPLQVTLPWYSELGRISIERLDREGKPTGKPLASGTPVEIVDPKV